MSRMPEPAKLLAGLRVLVVEDETLVAMLLEDMVADLGGEVVACVSRLGRAMEVIADPASRFDLAILDVNLGGEEAFPAAAALAERSIPFAFSTGYGSVGLPPAWRSRPTLQKPFTHEQVCAVLSEALLPASAVQADSRSTAVTPSMTN